MRRLALILPLASVALGACEDTTGFQINPLISTDTVEVAAPEEGSLLPTALDVTSSSGFIGGGRFPERAQHAGEWDFAIRERDGALVFVPAGALGLDSRAAITRPLEGRTFDEVDEAPGPGSFVADSAVVIEVGAVYVARSRDIVCGFSSSLQYAKLQPLEVDLAAGTVRLRIQTNERCGDPRLVED